MNQVMKIAGYAGMIGGTLYLLDQLGVFSLKTLLGK